jgi:hypothetical protein
LEPCLVKKKDVEDLALNGRIGKGIKKGNENGKKGEPSSKKDERCEMF